MASYDGGQGAFFRAGFGEDVVGRPFVPSSTTTKCKLTRSSSRASQHPRTRSFVRIGCLSVQGSGMPRCESSAAN